MYLSLSPRDFAADPSASPPRARSYCINEAPAHRADVADAKSDTAVAIADAARRARDRFYDAGEIAKAEAFEGKAAYHEQIAVRQREDAARLRQQMGASGGEKNVEWRIDDGKTPGTHGRLSCDSRRITPAHPIPLVSPGFVAAAVFPRRLCLHILHDIEVGAELFTIYDKDAVKTERKSAREEVKKLDLEQPTGDGGAPAPALPQLRVSFSCNTDKQRGLPPSSIHMAGAGQKAKLDEVAIALVTDTGT